MTDGQTKRRQRVKDAKKRLRLGFLARDAGTPGVQVRKGQPAGRPPRGGNSLERLVSHRMRAGGRRRGKTMLSKLELKRDPGDLVLSGKGTAAQERKRDPGDLLRGGKARRRRRRAQGRY